MAERRREVDPSVKKRVQDDAALFTVGWSPLRKAEKYDIINVVPAEAGVYELYYEDEKKKLNLMLLSRAWYGGLRSHIRTMTDPELTDDERRRRILENYTCYYRYTVCRSAMDIQDVLYALAARHLPKRTIVQPSGRYTEVLLEEVSTDKIVTI